MKTTVVFEQKEIKTLSEANVTRKNLGLPIIEWDGFIANQTTGFNPDPIVLPMQGGKPFPDNQGMVKFTASGKQLLAAIEPSEYSSGSVHMITDDHRWDYARTMTLMTYGDENAVKLSGINPEENYVVECHGGSGYVYIHRIGEVR